ncbi:MAG: glycosyltransferase family 39 protein [Blastocatellales bacterium]
MGTQSGGRISRGFPGGLFSRSRDSHQRAESSTQSDASATSWFGDYYIWLPLMGMTWWLAWHFQDQYIADWDGFDYTVYAIQGLPSALGLGRSLFLGYNHLLLTAGRELFSIGPEKAHLLIRYVVIAQSGPAMLGFYALARELTRSRAAAFLAALMIAASPPFIVYSGRGMSEIPGFLVLGWSLWWMARSLRRGETAGYLMAALMAGLSANIREFAVFYLPFIGLAALCYGRSWKLGATGLAVTLLGAFSGIIFWTLYYPDGYWPAAIDWYRLSAHEREIYPVTPLNLKFYLVYSFRCSAAALVLTLPALALGMIRRSLLPAVLLGATGLLANLSMIANHDLAVNPRYMLTGLPGMAVICGWCLSELIRIFRWRSLLIIVGLIVLTKASYNYAARKVYDDQWNARQTKAAIARIDHLPWNSGFIIGSRTPLINYLAGIGAHLQWKAIPTGAGWPDDRICEAVDDLLLAGRAVYIDFDPNLWQTGTRTVNRQAEGLIEIRRSFEMQHLHDHFYRILKRKNFQH